MLKTQKFQFIIEITKELDISSNGSAVALEMGDDIESYLKSMQHSSDTLWEKCSVIVVKASNQH